MLYPETFEQKIGFDKIRELLHHACISPLGQSFVDKIRFSDNFHLINKRLQQVIEFKTIIQYEPSFPSSNYLDIRTPLAKAQINGMMLTEKEFFDLKLTLQTIQQCLCFLDQQEAGTYPHLTELAQVVSLDKKLIKALDQVIDDHGHVRDTASLLLANIRRKIIAEQTGLRKKLDGILKNARSQGWVSDDTSLTIRNGRIVLPVQAEYKRRLKGFIHDESATGQTVFIEPVEVFDTNNEIRELEYEEQREIHRILHELTDQLRPHLPELNKATTFLGLIDFIRAKGRLAVQLSAEMPQLADTPVVNWQLARHPLLDLSFRNQNKKVTPLTIRLDGSQRILLISGPNAGGKSVALKTIGLLQYMLQCGLLIPVVEGSVSGIFQHIFIDIGDEQSLENDLSTYSSHLTSMKSFLALANKRTLFLLDEFGTGTEPDLGGSIAEAILEELNASGAYGVVNTHYTNLKLFADKTPGLINGAMRFDGERLEPLYELEIGRPGSSFAFEIASKIGLPKHIIDRAKEKLGAQQVNLEKLLKELASEKQFFTEKNLEIEIKQRNLAQQVAETNALKTNLSNDRKHLLNEAKQKAKTLIAEANQRIENTIREIKEGKAERENTRLARQELERFEKQVLSLEHLEEDSHTTSLSEDYQSEDGVITIGSYVRIDGQPAVGEVLALKGKDAEIRIGDLKSNVKLNRLKKVSRKAYRDAMGETSQPKVTGIDLNEKMMNFSFNLDIRGKRGEEAMIDLDHFINNALMLGYPELRIVHGKGDGILRNLVRSHLRTFSEVASMQDEHADRGGAGVTVIRMR